MMKIRFVFVAILIITILSACTRETTNTNVETHPEKLLYEVVVPKAEVVITSPEWQYIPEDEKYKNSNLIVSGKVISSEEIYFEIEWSSDNTDKYYKTLLTFEIDKSLKDETSKYKKGDIITVFYNSTSHGYFEDAIPLPVGEEAILLLLSTEEVKEFHDIGQFSIGNETEDIFIKHDNYYYVPQNYTILVVGKDVVKENVNYNNSWPLYKVSLNDIESMIKMDNNVLFNVGIDVISNNQDLRLCTNANGLFITDSDYIIISQLGEADDSWLIGKWSPDDSHALVMKSYEWVSLFYLYDVQRNVLNKIKLFEEIDSFEFLLTECGWIDSDTLVFQKAYGNPLDGSEPVYKEFGYRRDIYLYNIKENILKKLTDSIDGEYYKVNDLNVENGIINASLVTYNNQNSVETEAFVEYQIATDK